MTHDLLITDDELASFHQGEALVDRAHALFLQQRSEWALARGGYDSLEAAEYRTFAFEGFEVRVQFNPGRLTSSSAKVDEASIRARKCFLCPAHLPPGQRGLAFGWEYLILCNPYPIFPEHFTITHRQHTPQRIDGVFPTFLQLSRELGPRYSLLYNGPKCGASAPDHLHFQAGSRGFLPIEQEYPMMKGSLGEEIWREPGLTVFAVENYVRRCIVLESAESARLVQALQNLLHHLGQNAPAEEEPMVNILALHDGVWKIMVFPREKHRPDFYHAEGEERILLSPAAVDLGGVCITPREEDFRNITPRQIVRMYDEVSLTEEKFRRLRDALSRQ